MSIVYYFVEVSPATAGAFVPYKDVFYHPVYDPRTLNRANAADVALSTAAKFAGPNGEDLPWEGAAWALPFGSANVINPGLATPSSDPLVNNKNKLELLLLCHIPHAGASTAKFQHVNGSFFTAIQMTGPAGAVKQATGYKLYRGDDFSTPVFSKIFKLKYIATNGTVPTGS